MPLAPSCWSVIHRMITILMTFSSPSMPATFCSTIASKSSPKTAAAFATYSESCTPSSSFFIIQYII